MDITQYVDIFYAEDERDIRDLVRFTLESRGWTVHTAINGDEALRLLLKKSVVPKLILLDARMPSVNGYEACRVLKQMPSFKHIPVVFLTAKGQDHEMRRGLDAGAVEYLLKPFAPDQLIQSLESVFQRTQSGPPAEQIFDKNGPDDAVELIDRLVQEMRSTQHLSNELETMRSELEETKSALHKLTKSIEINTELNRKVVENKTPELTNKSMQNRAPKQRSATVVPGSSQIFRDWVKKLLFLGESTGKPRLSQPPESDGQYPLAELSRITDGIVHDMRNGIGIIRNTIGFMSDDLSNTPHAKDVIKISRSLDFCEVVLRNLSALGGQDMLRPEWVNLEKIAREICFMLENKLVDVKLDIDPGGSEPLIYADPGYMRQVFMNLIKNAGEAMPEGGTLTCRFEKKKRIMKIQVQDTGQGISEQNQKKLFVKFFTTKERGYGIGLFIVHTIVTRLRGKINVVSTVGKGTTFTLFLPIEGEHSE